MSTSPQTEAKSSPSSLRSVDSSKTIERYLTDSALVHAGPCLLLAVGGSYESEAENITPTSHEDPLLAWTTPENAYNDNVSDNATYPTSVGCWSAWLGFLYTSSLLCEGIRLYAFYGALLISKVDVDYWNGSDWVDVYEGAFADRAWDTILFSALTSVSKFRVRFFNNGEIVMNSTLYDIDFRRRKIFDVKVYDGFNTSGHRKDRLVLSSTGSRFHKFPKPIYCARGLYVNFAESVGSCFVRYLPL